MAYVPSYAFGTDSSVDSIFLEAFERIQIPGSMLDTIKTDSAFRSVNSLLVEWLGKYEVDFTRKRKTFNLVPNQNTYLLSPNTFNVIDVLTTTVMSVTKDNGNAYGFIAKEGDPNNFRAAFQPPFGTRANVVMSTVGDTITWSFIRPSPVAYVCILAAFGNTENVAALDLCIDGDRGLTDRVVFSGSLTNYLIRSLTWIYNENSLVSRRYSLILKKGYVAIAGIFFGVGAYQKVDTTTVSSYVGSADRVLGPISFSDWMNTASKNTLGTVSSYVFDAGIPPKLILYPVPGLTTPQLTDDNALATNVMYSCNCFPADVVDLVQTFDVPKAFIEALISGLAFRLAQKFKPELMQITGQMAEQAMANAFKSNYSTYPLTLEPKRGLG